MSHHTVNVEILQRGSTSKIIFSISTSNFKNENNFNKSEISSKQINISNKILAKFKFEHHYNKFKSNLKLQSVSMSTVETASNPVIPLKITCMDFNERIYCTNKWTTIPISQICDNKDQDSIYQGHIWVASFLFHMDITVLNMQPTAPLARNSLYEDTEFTDFDLSTSDGSVPVHKAILFMHSDMFKLMMRGEWKETSQGRISMDGVTVQTLKQLKDYMYLDALPSEDDHVETLLQIAAHYFMDKLKTDCIARLSRAVTPHNLDHLLELACVLNLPDLVRAILFETPDDIVTGAYQLRMNKQQSDGQKSVS